MSISIPASQYLNTYLLSIYIYIYTCKNMNMYHIYGLINYRIMKDSVSVHL